MTREEAVERTRRHVSAQVFRVIIFSGVPVAEIARKVGRDEWKLRETLQSAEGMTLDIMSDIGLACGIEFDPHIRPIEK